MTNYDLLWYEGTMLSSLLNFYCDIQSFFVMTNEIVILNEPTAPNLKVVWWAFVNDLWLVSLTAKIHNLFYLKCFDFRVVFVDAGVTQIDIDTKKMKEEQKMKEAQARAVAEHGELALITVEGPQSTTEERISLRPPMLQVINCF